MSVTLYDIVDYLGDSRESFLEGERILEDKHILNIGIKNKSCDVITVEALCIKPSAINDFPHVITIEIFNSGEKKFECQCSCEAGAGGKCKHIVGCLLLIQRTSLDEMEVLSSTCTSEWAKDRYIADEIYKDVPISEYCCVKNEKKIYSMPSSENEVIKQLVLKIFNKT